MPTADGAPMKWEEDMRKGEVRGYHGRAGSLYIAVHHHIDEPPDQWFVTVRGLDAINRRPLLSRDPEKAKAEAVEVVRRWLTSALAALPEGR